jgi:hypothetical protein
MIRRILCPPCAQKLRPQHPEDVALGWKLRTTRGLAHKPAVHEVRIISAESTEIKTLASLVCDTCGQAIADGSEAVAVTQWRGEGEPLAWEHDYLTTDVPS